MRTVGYSFISRSATGCFPSFTALKASCSGFGFSPHPSRMIRTKGRLASLVAGDDMWNSDLVMTLRKHRVGHFMIFNWLVKGERPRHFTRRDRNSRTIPVESNASDAGSGTATLYCEL